MKVIGINGSARKNGNTAILIRTIFEELNKKGVETELIQLADVDIEPCRACFACKGKDNCVFRKDGLPRYSVNGGSRRNNTRLFGLFSRCFIPDESIVGQGWCCSSH